MTYPTKDEIDLLYRDLSDDEKMKPVLREVGRLLKIARDSEQFKSAVGGFAYELIGSITPMGMKPDPLMRMSLLNFVLGYQFCEKQGQGGSTAEPQLDMGAVNRLLEAMDTGLDEDPGDEHR